MGLPYADLTEAATGYGKPTINASAAIKAQPLDVKAVALGKQESALKKQLAAIKQNGGKDVDLEHQAKELKAESADAKFATENNIENAAKKVQAYVRAGIEGLFQGCSSGPKSGTTRQNTTFAVMSQFIEDRPPVADIWPANEMIWGAIFANPKFITPEVKALPRAKELSARWGVEIPPDRADDKTKVAIIWSVTGESNNKLDTNGTFTIAKADGLTAYDMTGRVIPAGADGLTVPFGNNPIWITSDTLSVVDLRNRIAHGVVIKNVTPVLIFYALSLMDDPTKAAKVVGAGGKNQLNVPVKGTLHLKVAGASEETSAPFTIEAAKLTEVPMPWPTGVKTSDNNQYSITVSAEAAPSDDLRGEVGYSGHHQQATNQASVARFVKKTIAMTGTVDDWKGVTPVLLDSSQFNQEIDLSQYVLHPDLEKPSADAKAPHIVARMYTAYDKDNVYLAAAVNEPSFGNKAGAQMIKGRGHPSKPGYITAPLPYTRGIPDGLGFPTLGSCLEFCFGFRDRVPGWGRQMDDPYAWKGSFFDTDYCYFANPSADGDMLTRVWSPNTPREDGYQTTKVPGQGIIALSPSYNREGTGAAAATPAGAPGAGKEAPPGPSMQDLVSNAKIKITRDEDTKTTLYEMTIPRAELKLFDPEKGRCRFGFNLYTNGADKSGEPELRRCSGCLRLLEKFRIISATLHNIPPARPSLPSK